MSMLHAILKLFLLTLICSQVFANDNLTSFTSDGCTLSPDGTPAQPNLWRECCVEHDLWFWGGGTKEQRILADNNLKSCIAEKSSRFISAIYLFGVQVGRLSPFKIKNKKWGNGWIHSSKRENYFTLSKEQVSLILDQLNTIQINPQILLKYRTHLSSL
jgi:hypothetical protein